MRIIVLSDSHGDLYRVRQIFEDNCHTADCFIHLGDGLRDFQAAARLYPEARCFGVRGNCDLGCQEPKTSLVTLEDKKILYTHGDLYHVKYGLAELTQAGREQGADIILYGHTHYARADYEDGLYLLNPGSVYDSQYTPAGYLALDITPAGVVPVPRVFLH